MTLAADPLDRSIDVMIDQGASIATQLCEVLAARAALVNAGEDPDVLLAGVTQELEVARQAVFVSTRVARDRTALSKTTAALIAQAGRWFGQLDNALRNGTASGDPAVSLAVAEVRAGMKGGRRNFAPIVADLAKTERAFAAHLEVLRAVPTFPRVLEEGAALTATVNAHDEALRRVAREGKAASQAAGVARLALLKKLREVRRLWTCAVDLSETEVPALDLRISLMAAGRVRRRAGSVAVVDEFGLADGAERPSGGASGGDEPAGTAIGEVVEAVDPGEVVEAEVAEPAEDAHGCAEPTVVVTARVVVGG